ncbi:MAG: response regulator [Verrucomicrobiales bacterium]
MRLDPAYSTTAPKVLVIDDDKGLREIIRMTLMPRCQVKTAASVDEGLKIFQSLDPNLVIIDYQMPVKNGIQGIEEIREIDPEVPVILLTAFADLEMAREAMTLGVTEYMTKPFNVTDLKQVVEEFTTPRAAEGSVKEAEEAEEAEKAKPMERRFEIEDDPGASTGAVPSPPKFAPPRRSAGKQKKTPGLGASRHYLKENYIECRSPLGAHFRANILRLNPRSLVCEIFSPELDLQVGDIVTECRMELGNSAFRVGAATVKELVDTGILLICELSFREAWFELGDNGEAPAESNGASGESDASSGDLSSRIDRPFKKIVSALDGLLEEMGSIMGQFDERLKASDVRRRDRMEQHLIRTLCAKVTPAMNRLSTRFEEIAGNAPPGREDLHRLYVRHHLNRHFSFAPAVPRGSDRPTGCPGDFSIPDRLLQPAPPKASLYEKAIASWLLGSPTGEAASYRTHFLTETLCVETNRALEAGRSPRIFTIVRGQSGELEDFLHEFRAIENLELTLMAFDEKILQETQASIRENCRLAIPGPSIHFVHKPINQFLAQGNQLIKSPEHANESKSIRRSHYDLVYCSGVFHHFSDRVCRRLMQIFFEMTTPGGLSVVCDLTPRNPLRHLINFVLDEDMVHRTRQEMLALVPRSLAPEFYRITDVPNGVESFLHVLKPEPV